MIKQAIIPLAGLGTRLLPLTSVFAKELLPINGRPGIEYIIDECIDAGIKEIIFIISKKKMMIKNYFYSDRFYKNLIKKKKDPRIIKEYKKIFKLCVDTCHIFSAGFDISSKKKVRYFFIVFKLQKF